MLSKIEIKAGDRVRLKKSIDQKTRCPEGRENNATSTIKALLADTEGGLFLVRDLRGCRYWNVEDVVLA